MNRKSTKRSARTKPARKGRARISPTPPPIPGAGVWTGSIGRLRVYDTQTSTGNVFAYKSPGHNSDLVGNSTDADIIKALFLARDNGGSVTGATDGSGRITWLDY